MLDLTNSIIYIKQNNFLTSTKIIALKFATKFVLNIQNFLLCRKLFEHFNKYIEEK